MGRNRGRRCMLDGCCIVEQLRQGVDVDGCFDGVIDRRLLVELDLYLHPPVHCALVCVDSYRGGRLTVSVVSCAALGSVASLLWPRRCRHRRSSARDHWFRDFTFNALLVPDVCMQSKVKVHYSTMRLVILGYRSVLEVGIVEQVHVRVGLSSCVVHDGLRDIMSCWLAQHLDVGRVEVGSEL